MVRSFSIRRSERTRIGLETFLLVLLVLLTASQLSVYIPFYSQAAVLLLATIIAFILDNRYFTQLPFVFLILYVSIVLVNFVSGDVYFSSIIHVFEELWNLLLPSAVLYYVLRHNNVRLLKALVVFFIVYVIYVTIASTIVEAISPGAIRHTVVYANIGDFGQIDEYLRKGLSSYMFPHALPITIPSIVMAIGNKALPRWQRALALLFLSVVIYMIYLSAAATALLLAIVILFASLFARDFSNNRRLVMVIFVGVLLFSVMYIWLNNGLLHDLSSLFADTPFGSKFDDMEKSFNSGVASGDIDSRAGKYRITSDAFTGHLLFGSNDPMGEHSALYDRLGTLGLVGFIPYVIFMWLQIKLTKRYIHKNATGYYWLGIIAALVMLLLKNTSNWHLWSITLLYMPLMIIFFNPNSNFNE